MLWAVLACFSVCLVCLGGLVILIVVIWIVDVIFGGLGLVVVRVFGYLLWFGASLLRTLLMLDV